MTAHFRVASVEDVPDTYGVKTFRLETVERPGVAPIRATLTIRPFGPLADLAEGDEVELAVPPATLPMTPPGPKAA